MDAAEVWNEFDEYSLFLPDDSFNLFGLYNLDLDFNDFPAPAIDEASMALDMADWERMEVTSSASPDLNLQSSRIEQLHDFIPNSEADLPGSDTPPYLLQGQL